MKKQTKNIGIVLSVIAIVLILAMVFQFSPTTYNYKDEKLGLITQKIIPLNFLTKIVNPTSQIYYPDKTSYKVGEAITGKSYIYCYSGASVANTELIVTGGGSQLTLGWTGSIPANGAYHSWSIPTKVAGDYKVYDCYTCSNDGKRVCSNSGYTSTIKVENSLTSCPADKRVGSTEIWPNQVGNPDGLVFFQAEKWQVYTLSGGICNSKFEDRNWETDCEDNYYCGSTQSSTCSGKRTCTPVPENSYAQNGLYVNENGSQFSGDSSGTASNLIPVGNPVDTNVSANTNKDSTLPSADYTLLYIFGAVVAILVIFLIVTIVKRK